MSTLTYDTLRQYFLEQRDIAPYSENFRLRIHRALSWLKKAEQDDDLDMKFIALWVAFNAAYAKDVEERIGDKANFKEFLQSICELDKDKQIYHLVWKTFSQSIRVLLNNPFVFQPFWDFHHGRIDATDYARQENQERDRVLAALEAQTTEPILEVMFRRLYTLRNQIMHGGSTHQSSVNRSQLSDACNILMLLIPLIIQIMMENHDKMDWGSPYYPVVKS